MSRSAYDYEGYNKTFLIKRDLTPKNLKKFGIRASVKDIKARYKDALTGSYIATGGTDWDGVERIKHVKTYSISKLREIFKD